MAQSRTPAANATPVVVRSGVTMLNRIRVKQFAGAAAALFLQIFDHASPTVGTTAPIISLRIPAGDSKRDSMRMHCQFSGNDMILGTALSYAVTTTFNGSTNPTAGQEPEVIIDWEPLT